MSQNDSTCPPPLSDAAWERLAEILDQFCQAWDTWQASERGDPPDLAAVVPAKDDPLRYAALVELVKIDMEYRAGGHESLWQPLEDYLTRWPDLTPDGNLPAELIYEEYRIRRMAGAACTESQYQARFPGAFESLTRLLAEDKSTGPLARPTHNQAFDVGDRIEDFDLLTRLGKGAFATVFLARQNSMQRLVALKISAATGREHQMLAQLDHPHIVRVYDQRVIDEPPVRLMYMQHIAGGTLQEVAAEARQLNQSEALHGKHLVAAVDALLNLRGESPPVHSEHRAQIRDSTWSRVISRIGHEIALALAYAHERDVLHRDLKPANVLLDKECTVKLVDFNISFCSKLDGAAPAAYFGGSLAYMSPEQLEACSPDHDRRPEDLDGRSDLFSLGIILFELATGQRPFANSAAPGQWSATMATMLEARQRGLSESEDAKLDALSPMLARSIRRALAGPRDDRFANATQMAHHLALAGDPRAEKAFAPESGLPYRIASRSVLLAVGLLTWGISAAAAVFIFSYNLVKSVPNEALDLFQRTFVPIVNLTFFSLAVVLLLLFTRRIRKAIRIHRERGRFQPGELPSAISDNLQLGNWAALMCFTEWTFGGISYPALLTLADYQLTLQHWFDFFVSHFLAGLIAGAYVFWLTTWCSVRVWQPILLEASLDNDEYTDWTPRYQWLSRYLGIYNVLALAVPPIAIIWLVLYHESRDQFALTVVSLVSVLGLIVLSWAASGVRRQLDLLMGLVPRSADATP